MATWFGIGTPSLNWIEMLWCDTNLQCVQELKINSNSDESKVWNYQSFHSLNGNKAISYPCQKYLHMYLYKKSIYSKLHQATFMLFILFLPYPRASNTGSTDWSPHMEVWSWVRKPSLIIIENYFHGELCLWIGVLKITTPLQPNWNISWRTLILESRKWPSTHTLWRLIENIHFLLEFQKYRHSSKYVELCVESQSRDCTRRLLSCIYQWIGNKRCKRGERVLKQPTVWISIIKITN